MSELFKPEAASGAIIPDDLVEVGAVTYGDMEFTATVGRSLEMFSQLVAKARERQMLDMVPKDAAERFASEEAAERWYGKGRFLFGLWYKGEVALDSWYGTSSFAEKLADLRQRGAEINFEAAEGTDHTMAIRVFEGFAGLPRPQGETMSLARRALIEGQSLYVQSIRQAGGLVVGQQVWIETNAYEKQVGPGHPPVRNRSLYLYENTGYQEVGTYLNPSVDNPEKRVALARPLAGLTGRLVLPEA